MIFVSITTATVGVWTSSTRFTPSARPAKDVDHDEAWPQILYSRFEDVDGFLKIFHRLDDHFSWFYLLFITISLMSLLETFFFLSTDGHGDLMLGHQPNGCRPTHTSRDARCL